MQEADLDQVLAIECASFPSPWRKEHFLHELRNNPIADSRVLRRQGRVLGYACLWRLHGELKINNIAIHPSHRRRGLGGWLLRRVLELGRQSRCHRATLEVRASNAEAKALYRRNGFVPVGRHRNYYQLEGEDAILMAAPLGEAP
jgi:ribosomal-protein-alanine N-acetyltransferase